MKIIIHQTKDSIGDFESIYKNLIEIYQKYTKDQNEVDKNNKKLKVHYLHVFPELYLTGYPLQDLCLQREFIQKYLNLLNKINIFFTTLKDSNQSFLLGGLEYNIKNNIPYCIKNIIYYLTPGQKLKSIYQKILLPNYDIFDESKYFTAGNSAGVLKIKDFNIALLICEDMWFNQSYNIDPVELLKLEKINFDLIINLSASPYFLNKENNRTDRALQISNKFNAPFVYVNRVGAEDEIIFDGQSFIVNNSQLIKLEAFKQDSLEYLLSKNDIKKPTSKIKNDQKLVNTAWDDLFSPRLIKGTPECPLILQKLNDAELEMILKTIQFGFQDYVLKSNIKKFSIALSGGIDSALVLAIIYLSLKEDQKLEAIFMPGKHTNAISYQLCEEMISNLKIPFYNLPIKFLDSTFQNAFLSSTNEKLSGVSLENLQSRIRGAMLYAFSNQHQSLVFNTSNKSELSVGYSTLYGDSVGALSLIGDLYKSEVFDLARYINKKFKNIIPEEIITRPPSAELRDNQKDIDSLPPYKRLDSILEAFLSNRYSFKDLLDIGFLQEEIKLVSKLYKNSEFKRKQICPILKLKSKSFGFGYRIPINYIV